MKKIFKYLKKVLFIVLFLVSGLSMYFIIDACVTNNESSLVSARAATGYYAITYLPNKPSTTKNEVDGTMQFQQASTNAPVYLRKNIFSLEGYVFCGWGLAYNASPDDALPYVINEPLAEPTKQVNLYAIWRPITYTVRYVNPVNSLDKMNDQVFTYDKKDTLNACSFNYAENYFSHWISDLDNNETFNDGADFTNMTAEDGKIITLPGVGIGGEVHQACSLLLHGTENELDQSYLRKEYDYQELLYDVEESDMLTHDKRKIKSWIR